MRIVFCSSEVVPFAKTGGLADVCGALPLALEKLGEDLVIIMPRYRCVDFKTHSIKPLNDQVSTARIGDHIQVYFIEETRYFDRAGLYGDSRGDYHDNLERFQFFCGKSLELIKQLNLRADILHLHDWQTALIAAYLKILHQDDPFYKNMKTIMTIHNMAYQGVFPANQFPKLGLEKKYFNMHSFEFFHQVNLLKGGIVYADRVTTVSPSYAQEIQTQKLGCGLEGVLRQRKDKVIGILNGLDVDTWNPQADWYLQKKYSVNTLEDKKISKKKLQERFSLLISDEIPLFGFVGRLCYQKGVDLIVQVMHDIIRLGGQVLLTGVGERKYHRMLEECARNYPKQVGVYLKFEERLAHQIYAGSDFFLMPSVYEPCGLGQMIALRYGSIPIVYKTGGLADTISLYDRIHHTGNGFLFTQYTKDAFVKAVTEVVKVYEDPKQMRFLVPHAMRYNLDRKSTRLNSSH